MTRRLFRRTKNPGARPAPGAGGNEGLENQGCGTRREDDLSGLKGGVRGKYAERYRAGTNLVLLSPNVARYFPDEQSVNGALRSLIGAGKGSLRRAR